MKKLNRIVFMGTPDFAVASLKALVENGYPVVGVVTAPDKPAGRGQQVKKSDVKLYAESQNLKILQPEKLKNEEFLAELKALNADLNVVVAFRMLPVVVWDMPPLGSINVHGSLLPNYRGAAPIHWAVINGEKKTGVSTFFLKHEIDTGNIIGQASTPIGEDETTGEVYYRLMHLGAELLLKTLEELENGTIKEVPQDLSIEAKHAPKIFKEDCKISWHKSAHDIHNLVRGLNPFPSAFTSLEGKNVKIHTTKISSESFPLKAGEIKVKDKKLFVGTGKGLLEIIGLQMEGKKRCSALDFINAYQDILARGFEV
ncbi:MAG: methionyl-tRNA formyltransferase [Chitinophagales bacterium]|nr:methionyl-tRNA formyltransferase [Chitinophagales bacterium]